MNRILFSFILLMYSSFTRAQPTFKAGWNTYPVGTITHEYAYNLGNNDTTKITLIDSSVIYTSKDSLVTMVLHTPFREKAVYKTIHYFNVKKQILKTEEYKDDNMVNSKEWRYDDKNRKNYYYEENKISGNNFRKTYDYAPDKKTGDFVVSESSYFNGRIEFYTRTYYDKKSVKYKEIRLNDNNKDVVHIETFYYGDNGKLTERSVYFPEWRGTKKFAEREGSQIPKCYKCLPVGTAEKILLAYRVPFMKRLLVRNMVLLTDPECDQFEYTFKNFTNVDVVVTNCNLANTKRLIFRFKDKY